MGLPVKLKFAPHTGTPRFPGGQVRMIFLTIKNHVVVAPVGRRWGKTQGSLMAIMAHMVRPKYAGRQFRAAYCGPTYKASKRVYDEAKIMFGGKAGSGLIEAKSDSELWIRLRPVATEDGTPNGGALIQFWSLENHDNLRGDRLDFVVLDEFSDVKEEAWEATIKPMLVDMGGHALIIGTPKRGGVGFHWARREFLKGQDPEETGYACMTGPSEGNPFLNRDFLARARRDAFDPATEREEYDAEFLDDQGATFERIEEAFVLPWQKVGEHICQGDEPREGALYCIGYDIGRHDDWAVFVVWDWERQRQVYLERGISMPFREQLDRLTKIRARYNNAFVWADDNGMGEMQFEELALLFGNAAFGRKWNHARKEADVARAAGLFQRAEWKFLNVPWQKRQFYCYRPKKLPSGGYRYEALSGEKDDAVTANCLVAHKVAQGYPTEPEKAQAPQMFDKDGRVDFSYWEAEEEKKLRLRQLGLM